MAACENRWARELSPFEGVLSSRTAPTRPPTPRPGRWVNHLSEGYYRACARLGGRLARPMWRKATPWPVSLSACQFKSPLRCREAPDDNPRMIDPNLQERCS